MRKEGVLYEIERQRDALVGLARKIISAYFQNDRRYVDADDIVQNAILKLLTNTTHYDEGALSCHG